MRARPPHLAFKTALKNSQPFAIDGVLQFAGARRDSRQAVEEYILLLLTTRIAYINAASQGGAHLASAVLNL